MDDEYSDLVQDIILLANHLEPGEETDWEFNILLSAIVIITVAGEKE